MCCVDHVTQAASMRHAALPPQLLAGLHPEVDRSGDQAQADRECRDHRDRHLAGLGVVVFGHLEPRELCNAPRRGAQHHQADGQGDGDERALESEAAGGRGRGALACRGRPGVVGRARLTGAGTGAGGFGFARDNHRRVEDGGIPALDLLAGGQVQVGLGSGGVLAGGPGRGVGVVVQGLGEAAGGAHTDAPGEAGTRGGRREQAGWVGGAPGGVAF